jgi:hypothetical protein
MPALSLTIWGLVSDQGPLVPATLATLSFDILASTVAYVFWIIATNTGARER